MFASIIVSEFRKVAGFRNLGLCDISDHLSTQGTFLVCMVCTAILSTTSFYLNPLTCIFPNAPSGKNAIKYATDYCWIHGTIPYTQELAATNVSEWAVRDERDRVSYYQWMPLYIGLMGVLSVLPSYIWQAISDSWMSSDYERGIQCAQKAVRSNSTKSIEEGLDEAAGTFHTMFSLFQSKSSTVPPQREKQSFWGRCCACFEGSIFFRRGLSYTRFLIFGYGLFKLSLLVMALLQLFILVSFLRGYAVGNFFNFLPSLFKDIIEGREWEQTGVFARRGVCVVHFTFLGDVQNRFVGQCTLTMNMLNEKLCIFLWFWFTALIALNFCGIVWWMIATTFQRRKIEFLRHYLNKLPEEMKLKDHPQFSDEELRTFVNNYLHQDGMFVIRMLKRDAGSWACARILMKLYALYRNNYVDDIPSYSELTKQHYLS